MRGDPIHPYLGSNRTALVQTNQPTPPTGQSLKKRRVLNFNFTKTAKLGTFRTLAPKKQSKITLCRKAKGTFPTLAPPPLRPTGQIGMVAIHTQQKILL